MEKTLQQITQETIDLIKASRTDLNKAITTATGLTGYSLEAPSKKLFPVLSPMRNRIPRKAASVGATAVNWKAITAINSANVKAGVAFGTRNSEVTTTVVSKSATFKTFGLDDSVQDEAVWMGRSFEDVRATAQANLLSAVMIQEEHLLMGGNTTTALGTPTAPTLAVIASGGTVPDATYNVQVVALPWYGAQYATIAAVNAVDHSLPSNATSTGALLNSNASIITAYTPLVTNAFAYVWYVGVGTAEKAEKITFINSVSISALLGTGELRSAISADTSAGANDFDGLFAQAFASGSGAYIKALATGTNGVGTGMTSDASGGITEIDAMLKSLWDNSRIGPTLILVNSQEAQNIVKKVINAGASAILRVQVDPTGIANLQAGARVGEYLNKYTGAVIPLMIHPFLPAGTMCGISEVLPYPNNNVPNVLEIEALQEYASFDWARAQRKYEFGIYANEVLKLYFPAGVGIITNIANA